MAKERINKNKILFVFSPLPVDLWKSPEYAKLSSVAVKLLTDIYAQCQHGRNNGDISIPWSLMSKRGWRSEATLNKAKKELLDAGFIEITKQGGKNSCTLFAVTWLRIEPSKKFDYRKSHAISPLMLRIVYKGKVE